MTIVGLDEVMETAWPRFRCLPELMLIQEQIPVKNDGNHVRLLLKVDLLCHRVIPIYI
ncbi:hypothetical protein D3C73_1182650 [compost metagenome]